MPYLPYLPWAAGMAISCLALHYHISTSRKRHDRAKNFRQCALCAGVWKEGRKGRVACGWTEGGWRSEEAWGGENLVKLNASQRREGV